nr:ABC transporter G family member 29-like [Malus domestica]
MDGTERVKDSHERHRSFSRSVEDVILSATHSRRNSRMEEEEEALTWAAIERLPTYNRLRTSIIKSFVETDAQGNNNNKVVRKEVDVLKLDLIDRQKFIDGTFKIAEEDNERFLKKFRSRIDEVGIKLPTVEVRFEHLTVEADSHIGSRALPTLPNVTRNIAESALGLIGIRLAKKTNQTILKDASGIVKPSRMTLLLGPPSSGKTTLLLALAGKLEPSLKVKGDITYNGYKLHDFVPQKTSAYISQNDVHIGEMTVKETLDFSARCQGVGTRYELLCELARREKDAGIFPEVDVDLFMKATSMGGVESSLITDYTLRILGLDICKDTIVGDEMQRGISGGQKKRVTTGPFPPFPCGHIVYQGPRELILEFFDSCGFRCPERKGTAEFLQEVTSRKDQEQYWADRGKPYQYISVTEFANQFKRFHVGMSIHNELSIPYNKSRGHRAALVFTRYSIPKLELLKACFAKEWLLIKRNSFVYIFKMVQISIVAVVATTVFLRTQMHTQNENDGALFISAIIFSLVTNLFNGFSELSLTIARLPVFYKHRDLLFHPAWTFTLPCVLLRIPISLLESTIWVGITYYTIGFAPEASRFFNQLLLFFLIQQMAAGMFRLIAGVCRTMIISNTGGSISLMIVFILGGFLIPRGEIPKWWMWSYWISPMAYGFNALAVNEMFAPRWMNKLASDNATRLGVAVLENFGIFPDRNWVWIGSAALVGYAVFFNILFTLVLMYLNPLGKPQPMISEEVAAEIRADEEESKNRLGRNANSSLEAGNVVTLKRGMVLPYTPLAMSFDSVNYYVDMPPKMKEEEVKEDRLQLLCEVTGAFRPGVLTALMGVSGAGKTTLMDVLAGRKTGGYIEGDIRISGYPKKQETFARISGYCEQNDIHSPQVTVKDSLIYSAFLRLPKEVTKEEKMTFVDEVMELVELGGLKDALVGLPGVTGLSEQRKRLTIAVELVANPSIIFMDEPTSGLDARAAAIVMRVVRNTVDTGRTVVCTIHQPSIDIFEAFDELLLMKRGGQLIYSGPLGRNSHKVVEYFEAVPGVPKIKEKYNPATWMLEVSSTATELRLEIDFAQHYKSSSLYQRNKALVTELSIPPPGANDLYFPSQYSQSMWEQFKCCLWKHWWTYWRSPDYILVRFFFTFASALLVGSIFWKVGAKRESSADLTMIIGAMYNAVLSIGINNCSTVQPVVATERVVFYRERAAGMYSAIPYALAQVVVEIPYVFVQTVYYVLIVYAMVSFQWTAEKFFWFFFVNFISFLYFTYYGMMTVAISPNHQVAAILASTFYSFFNLFSGFFIPRPKIPKWWIWYYWICPVAWTVYGLIVSQYGDVEDTIKAPGLTPDPTVKWYVENYFGYNPNFMGPVAGVLVGFALFFAFMFACCIKILNFQIR